MRFVGKAWKLLVGIKDGLVLLLLLFFFGALYSALSASPYKDSARRGALRLDLSGAIVEQPSRADPFAAALGGGPAVREYRVAQLIRALDAAAADDRIRAVALDLDIFTGGGQAAITNVGEALDRVRRAGKRVVAFATGYRDDGYQLAAHADEIWLDPLGAVLLTGPGGTNLYYAGLLERLGITANVYRVGAFKSAVEPYTRSDMSPEARAASQALANTLWETWQDDVRRARPRARLGDYAANPQPFIDAAGGDMARAALDAGLVDRIGDRTAFGRRMAELVGSEDERVPGRYDAVHYDAWADEHDVTADGGQIGILTVAGTIVDGRAGPGTAGGETIAEALEQGLRERRSARAGRAGRFAGRLRARLGADPARFARGQGARPAGRHLDGLGGGLRRLLDRDRRRHHLRRAVDDHRLDRRVRDPAELRGRAAAARHRRRRRPHDAALRRAGHAARPLARGGPTDPDRDRRQLPPLHPAGRAGAAADTRSGSTRSPRAGCGTAPRRGSSAWSTASAGWTTRCARRRGGRGSIPTRRGATYLERRPGFLARLLAGSGEAAASGPRDVFTRLAQRPQAMLERALHDAQEIAAGPAIQARCLDCPAVAPLPRLRAEAGGSWLIRLFAAIAR